MNGNGRAWKAPVEVNVNEVPGRQQPGKYDDFLADVMRRLEQTDKKHAIRYEFAEEKAARLHGVAVTDKVRELRGKGSLRSVRRGCELYLWRGEKW